ncbi:MAG: EamA family transporter [Streptosporangiales bacterium]|nr:EamA family transporter [Streptosporangiales bacterium]
MLGALFAVLSAATFGLNNATVRRGVISGTVSQALAITVPIGVPLFAIATLLFGQFGALVGFDARALTFLALAGVVHFVWGRYCNYRATKALGSNLAGPVQEVNVAVALALAIGWLGETLTPVKILGLALVVGGPTIAALGSRRRAARASAFEPKLREGYTFALLSATGYGVSPVLVKAGLAGSGASMAGGLVSYFSATLAFGLVLLLPGRLAHVRAVDRTNAKWFLASGFWVFLSQMFRFAALAIAPVTVVTPIQRLSVVFRLFFSTLLNREHEILDARVIGGVVVSLLGAVALASSIDSVAALLPLPEALKTWHWP